MSQRPEEIQRRVIAEVLGRTVPDGGSASAKALRQKCGLSDLGCLGDGRMWASKIQGPC